MKRLLTPHTARAAIAVGGALLCLSSILDDRVDGRWLLGIILLIFCGLPFATLLWLGPSQPGK